MAKLVMLNAPARGLGAFMPSRAATPSGASNGECRVAGAPGTMPIPSPKPPAVPAAAAGPNGYQTNPSYAAPDFILPSIYVSYPDGCSFPGKRVSDNVLPVPAGNWGRSAKPWNRRSRVGGQTATAWPRPFITFPTYAELIARARGGSSGS